MNWLYFPVTFSLALPSSLLTFAIVKEWTEAQEDPLVLMAPVRLYILHVCTKLSILRDILKTRRSYRRYESIRELKQRRRRQQRPSRKKIGLISKNNRFARAFYKKIGTFFCRPLQKKAT